MPALVSTPARPIRFLALAASLALTACSSAAEFRGLWVDAFGPGFFNAGQVKKLVADCRAYNFNAVLVEMRRRGDAFYNPRPPNQDPRTTIITTNFDALAEIIKECHSGTPRIEVHCWLVSHFVWAWEKPPRQPSHVFNTHPEYLTKDSIGQKLVGKGYFLDPGNPEANQTIYNAAQDVVSHYDIDGLHWDYFRYPNRDSGYNETAIRRYNEEFGLKGQPAPDDPRFSEWRRRQVADALRWINADLLELKPNLIISAAVFANIHDAQNYRFADWPAWNREGIIDVCMPMNFSPDNKNVFFPRADEALKSQGVRRIYLGQGAYMNPKENTLAQLGYAREKGFPGSVFYSYREPSIAQAGRERVFALLKRQFQPDWAPTPVPPWKNTKGIMKGTVTRKDTGTPIYNALVTLGTGPPRTQRTEPHGTYAFFDLSPGHYSLTAEAPGKMKSTVTTQAKAGEVTRADVALAAQ
jgi:uncharacterized lipoprotein YddW (UPF0748 family)